MSAKVEAAKKSRTSGKKVFIIVDDEGECSLSNAPLSGAIAAYANGSEVALSSKDAEKAPKATQKSKSSKVVIEEDEDEQKSDDEVKPKSNNKSMATAKTAKKAAKKTAPAKKSAVKEVKRESGFQEFKADVIAAGIKAIMAAKSKKSLLIVKGKVYAVNVSGSWAVRRTSVEAGKDGIIMVLPAAKGYFLYPKADFKELFGNIFKSNTWENIGIYSQSVIPKGHNDYWEDMPK